MADGYVQVAPDGGGKLIDGQSLTNGASQTVYRQTVTVGDPSSIGNVAGVTNGGLNNFGVGVAYTAGSGNSSTSQLAAGASFTGTVDSVTTQSAAEIGVICDQPYTVTINQFKDSGGTLLLCSYTFVRLANQPMNENIMTPAPYFQLIVTNNGLLSTTKLNISTTYSQDVTFPKTLSQQGNLQVALQESNATQIVGGVDGVGATHQIRVDGHGRQAVVLQLETLQAACMIQELQLQSAAQTNGFAPLEVPTFWTGI